MSESQPDIWVPRSREDTAFSREVVLDVQPHPTKAFVTPDGRHFQDCLITLTPEAAEKIWQGYACAKCLEGAFRVSLPEPFPEKCPLCGFPMKELQRKLLERDFLGVDPNAVGSFPLDRELEHLEREQHKPKGLMTVPKKVK